jgi:uncharacterized membrane protein
MNIRNSILIQLGLVVATTGYSLSMAQKLPSVVPTHWGINGKVDSYGSPGFSLWFGPGMTLFLALLTWVLPKISPKNFSLDASESAYSLAMVATSGLMGAMHFIILLATSGQPLAVDRLMMTILGLFFAVLGVLIGRIKKNFYVGIRTPWTLANDQVWEETHLRAGKLWLFGGLVVAVASISGVPLLITFPMFMSISLWPVAQSYFIYKRVEAQNPSPKS